MDVNKIIENLNNKSHAFFMSRKNSELILTREEKIVLAKFKPENVLIVYGSLAPNQLNHSKIKHIPGEWKKGVVFGKLENKGWGSKSGYYAYKPTSDNVQDEIKSFILFSNELNKYWNYLDEFEGEEYNRILTRYKLDTGKIGIGNIYALKK